MKSTQTSSFELEHPPLSMEEDRETALFRRYLLGDAAAFQSLYIANERSLYIYCRHMLGSEEEGQDAFQEIWTRLIRLRDRQNMEVTNFRGLLLTVARNTVLNHIRSRQNRRTVPIDYETIHTLSVDGGGFNETEELMHKAMQRLPEVQREAFVMHAVLGYTFHEIAAHQGVTQTGAKTRAFRARNALRGLMASWLGVAEDEREHTVSSAAHD